MSIRENKAAWGKNPWKLNVKKSKHYKETEIKSTNNIWLKNSAQTIISARSEQQKSGVAITLRILWVWMNRNEEKEKNFWWIYLQELVSKEKPKKKWGKYISE